MTEARVGVTTSSTKIERTIVLAHAAPDDAAAIAALHAESWRNAYRGMLPDQYLDEEIAAERAAFWKERFDAPASERRLILKATTQGTLDGFACALLDVEPDWGPRLDNFHVRPQLKGQGIGHALFQAAREGSLKWRRQNRCTYGSWRRITPLDVSTIARAARSSSGQRDLSRAASACPSCDIAGHRCRGV